MNQISTIVCFGVPESQVDMLIEATLGTSAEPRRWVVFGLDINLLGALDQQWSKTVNLTLVLLPGTSERELEAALAILSNEEVSPSECIWVRGPDVACSGPQDVLATFDANSLDVGSLVAAFSALIA